jgi:hypothetical protein
VARLLQCPVARSHDSSVPSASPCTSSGHTAASALPTLSPGPGLLLGRLGRMSVTLRPLGGQQQGSKVGRQAGRHGVAAGVTDCRLRCSAMQSFQRQLQMSKYGVQLVGPTVTHALDIAICAAAVTTGRAANHGEGCRES